MAREAFVRQFERYVKGQYPFDTPLEEGQDTLSYWNHLTKIPEGSVLAVILYLHCKMYDKLNLSFL